VYFNTILLTNIKYHYNINFTHKHTNYARNLHTHLTHERIKLEWVWVYGHFTQ